MSGHCSQSLNGLENLRMLKLGLSSRANLLKQWTFEQGESRYASTNPANQWAIRIANLRSNPSAKTPRKTSIPSPISTLPPLAGVAFGPRSHPRVTGSLGQSLRTICVSCMLRARTGRAAHAPISPTCCRLLAIGLAGSQARSSSVSEERIRVNGKNIGMPDLARVTASAGACRANVGGNR